jgi:hypothetical protein
MANALRCQRQQTLVRESKEWQCYWDEQVLETTNVKEGGDVREKCGKAVDALYVWFALSPQPETVVRAGGGCGMDVWVSQGKVGATAETDDSPKEKPVDSNAGL